MQSLRAATSGSRALTARPTARYPSSFTGARAFSAAQRSQAGGHESHYDPPSGWLFGVKPGEQYEKEGWENVMFWGFGGACAFGIIAYAFKPDTRYVSLLLERLGHKERCADVGYWA